MCLNEKASFMQTHVTFFFLYGEAKTNNRIRNSVTPK